MFTKESPGVEALDVAVPSGALLDRLAAADVAALSAADRVAAVIGAERLLSHVQMLQARFVAAVADDADAAAGC
ncbi:MAG TPA: hypothetical protein VNB94_00960, partial [Mycobacteriales bacterium]|nr:hypothetical protein [Mycobacteriales bacterium]